MKTRILLLITFLLVAAWLPAQQTPTVTAQPNTLYVSAEGKYEAAPDTARIQFDISAQENTAKAAYDRASKAEEQVRQILRSSGIEPKQAQFGFLSVNPVYDYRTPQHKLIAYRVNTNVVLKLKDFSKVAPIVQQLADVDVTANQSLSYTLENTEAAKIRAVEDAFGKARGEADALARAGGRVLGEMVYGSVDTSEAAPPRPMMRMMSMARTAEAAPPAPTEEFTPQNVTVTARVSSVFALK
jgi:uncharacterized protein